jgi:hypothetical protein
MDQLEIAMFPNKKEVMPGPHHIATVHTEIGVAMANPKGIKSPEIIK